tara:strand:- start:2459 stop:3103 length:645 start_codon:yes stop_codon:yes gene_type:complete
MKVKIHKQGKTKEYSIIKSWKDVTLEKWLKLISFKHKTKSEEAAATISVLSNIPKDLINQLELKHVAFIMNKMGELQAEQNSSLKRIIEVEGKRFGFHPDLDSMTLGEYADIETFIKNDIEKHLPEIMAVLYRPIVEETESNVYSIEAYDGNIRIRTELMKKMSSEQVQSALVFFYSFVSELSIIMQSYLTQELKGMKEQSVTQDLQTSGVGLV